MKARALCSNFFASEDRHSGELGFLLRFDMVGDRNDFIVADLAGLTADEQSQLGRRCYRSERNAAVPGSGLGLWIASTFVAANGGSLHAASQGPSLGATVSLRLPTGSENTMELLDTFND